MIEMEKNLNGKDPNSAQHLCVLQT